MGINYQICWIHKYFGGRKFFLTLFSIVLSYVALIFEYLDGSQWVTVVSIVASLYGVSNISDDKIPNSKK